MWTPQFFCSVASEKTSNMHQLTLIALVAVFAAVVAAEGQFYVPRAYYTIDAEGHASAPVPLRRLRRSVPFYPGAGASANANANAEANSWGGGDATANANANARADAGAGGAGGYAPRGFAGAPIANFAPPNYAYGASKPVSGSYRQAGPISAANEVSASSSAGLASDGQGYYDNEVSYSG